ncbi:MAG: HNH endonuclease family protein [Acidimicrobiales bacterium]
MLCRLTTKDYNSLYVELLNQLAETDPASRGSAVETFLIGQSADSRVWPADDAVRQALLTSPLYRLLTRARLRMVLEGIEDHLRGNKSEERVVRGKLTIEHVMPRGWHGHWPLPPSMEDEEEVRAAANREVAIHTIGNLTLLTQSLNSGISNSPWVDKRKAIEEFGVLRLSAPLKIAGEWSEATIAARSKDLAEVACQVWPRPKG